jgi:excisionase family DNA binding protein
MGTSGRSPRVPRRSATIGSLRWIATERARAARRVPAPRGPALRLTVELTPDQLAQLALRVSDLLVARDGGPAAASPYLTVSEAADYLRCSRERIHALLSQRRLTRHKDGGRTLVLRSELEAYVRPATELRRAA